MINTNPALFQLFIRLKLAESAFRTFDPLGVEKDRMFLFIHLCILVYVSLKSRLEKEFSNEEEENSAILRNFGSYENFLSSFICQWSTCYVVLCIAFRKAFRLERSKMCRETGLAKKSRT